MNEIKTFSSVWLGNILSVLIWTYLVLICISKLNWIKERGKKTIYVILNVKKKKNCRVKLVVKKKNEASCFWWYSVDVNWISLASSAYMPSKFASTLTQIKDFFIRP